MILTSIYSYLFLYILPGYDTNLYIFLSILYILPGYDTNLYIFLAGYYTTHGEFYMSKVI